MDEAWARTLLGLAADTVEPPAAGVDIQLARSRGRRKLRWRRAGLAGVPAAAVLAAVAGVTATAVPSGTGGNAPVRPAAISTPGQVTPPRQFSPLIPYADFGWLPDGESLDGGQITPVVTYLTAGPANGWALTLHVAGRCEPGVAKVLRQLGLHRRPALSCTGWAAGVASVAPPVAGHMAFWLAGRGSLAWQYAPGCWAVLAGPFRQAAIGDVIRVAGSIRYDTAARPSIEFPVRLTGLPPAPRVASIYFVADAGVLRASQFSLTGSGAASFTTDPASPRGSCHFYPGGQSRRETMNGYQVVVNHINAARGNPPVQQVCAADADGLAVFISTYGSNPVPDAISIFARHTRLLGTNPASWTTQPLG